MKKWESYEMYALDFLRHKFGEDGFEYQGKQKIYNPMRQDTMEVDGVIINKATNKKIILQCKYHDRKPDISMIEAFCFQCESIGASGIFITPNGYTVSSNKLENSIKKLQLHIFTEEDFEKYQYFELIAFNIVLDGLYEQKNVYDVLNLLIVHGKSDKALEVLDDIMYDEFLSFANFLFKKYKFLAKNFFTKIALEHYDAGWRFNAIQLLEDYHCLDFDAVELIKKQECDGEIIELLEGMGYFE